MDFRGPLRCTGCVQTRVAQARRSPAPAAQPASRAADPLRMTAWSRVDSGTSSAQLLLLQRLAGNQAVARLVATSAGGSVSLHGETTGSYDGGTSRIRGRRVTRAAGCDCPDEDPCRRATGTLEIVYRVEVTISMPPVPDGLTPCQERRVRAFLRTVLGPHEQDHRRRMRTYDGTTRQRFDVTGCGMEGLRDQLQTTLQQMHEDEATARQATAQASSDSIDPFERVVDLDCD